MAIVVPLSETGNRVHELIEPNFELPLVNLLPGLHFTFLLFDPFEQHSLPDLRRANGVAWHGELACQRQIGAGSCAKREESGPRLKGGDSPGVAGV